MEFADLVHALLLHDMLAARQWVADAIRSSFAWDQVPRPVALDPTELAVAAGMVEMFAERSGKNPPAWTSQVGAAPHSVFLVQAAASMPRLRKTCEEAGPWALRKRSILATPEFLTAA